MWVIESRKTLSDLEKNAEAVDSSAFSELKRVLLLRIAEFEEKAQEPINTSQSE